MTIRHLRYISLIEGISYLLLLFIGMPLKYGLGLPLANKVLGMGHGLLTILFCAILYVTWFQKRLSFKWSSVVFIASMIPFGAFFIDQKLKSFDESITKGLSFR